MKAPRVSIAALCVATALIAVDFTVLRWSIIGRESGVTVRGVLFMINVLGFGLYKLVKVGGRGCPFLIGFVATGSLVTLIYFDYCQLFYHTALRTQQWTLAPISTIVKVDHLDYMHFPCLGPGRLITTRTMLYSVIMTPIVTGIIALPQLLIAVFGGFVARRLTKVRAVTTHL
jgi:hypothetical protein